MTAYKDFHAYPIELFPGRTIHVACFNGLTPETARRLIMRFFPRHRHRKPSSSGKKRKVGQADDVLATPFGDGSATKPAEISTCIARPTAGLAPLQAALVDGEYVLSRLHLLAAATNALYRSENEGGADTLKTRSIYSEVLLCLSGKRSIDNSLRTYGLKETTTRLIVCAFDDPSPLRTVDDELHAFAATAAIDGMPRRTSWTELEIISPDRRALFLNFFKIGREESALIESLEGQEEEKEEEKERGKSSDNENHRMAEQRGEFEWLAGLEGAIVTRVGIQSNEKLP
jgi:tRNA threonylcarbamoyladenosine modification (KEOPS) complex Cgi121 subunit